MTAVAHPNKARPEVRCIDWSVWMWKSTKYNLREGQYYERMANNNNRGEFLREGRGEGRGRWRAWANEVEWSTHGSSVNIESRCARRAGPGRVTRDNKVKERENKWERAEEKRESFSRQWYKRPEGRCPLSRIERAGKGNARFVRSSCRSPFLSGSLSLVRRRANKPNGIVTRRLSVRMWEKSIFGTYKVTFFTVYTILRAIGPIAPAFSS